MAVYLIAYELRQPERNYEPFYAALKTYTHARVLETAWLVESAHNAARIRDTLHATLDADDGLIVARCEGELGWNKIDGDSDLWLLQRFRGSQQPG